LEIFDGHFPARGALLLAIQSQLFSERKLAELKWSRTVNTSGQQGHNIACDLHMEHINRRLKRMMANAGANKLQKPIARMAKSLGVVSHICSNFASESGATVSKAHHTYPSFSKDLETVTKVLRSEDIFSEEKCLLSSFNRSPILTSLNWKNIEEWVKKKR